MRCSNPRSLHTADASGIIAEEMAQTKIWPDGQNYPWPLTTPESPVRKTIPSITAKGTLKHRGYADL